MKLRLAQIDWLNPQSPVPDLSALAGTEAGALVLLPAAIRDEYTRNEVLPNWEELSDQLGHSARELKVFLSGAVACPLQDSETPEHVGFLFDPDGRCLLQIGKSMPDLLPSYIDVAANIGTARKFPIADVSIGRIGMVLGEDIFAPQLVRATVLAGAELVLNPCVERSDTEFSARQRLKAARAYENSCWVASVSPMHRSNRAGTRIDLPPAAVIADPGGLNLVAESPATLVDADVDLDELRSRRTRVLPPNFPVFHRTSLYAREAESRLGTSAAKRIEDRSGWQAEGRRRVEERANQAIQPLESPTYGAVLAQTVMRHVSDLARRDEIVDRNITDALQSVHGFASIPDVRLLVFPEFAFHGSPFGLSADQWSKIAFRFPGPELDRLSEFAVRNKSYIAGSAYEYDPDWPHRVFNSAFIINDSGDLIHRYRKIMCADLSGMLPVTTPGGVLSAYLDKYGLDYLFPVAQTPLGNLATVICFDINFSETIRAMTHRGAEVIIHPTDEPHNPWRRGWDNGRLTRALENRCYILSAGIGGSFAQPDDALPSNYNRGNTKVVDYRGRIAAIVDGPGTVPLQVDLDLAGLRRIRADDRQNWALWDDAEDYVDFYRGHHGYPQDLWIDQPVKMGLEGFEATQKVIERYQDTGIYLGPTEPVERRVTVRSEQG